MTADLTLVHGTQGKVQLFRLLESNTEGCCGENGHALINGIATAFGSVKTDPNFVAVPRGALTGCHFAHGISISEEAEAEMLREFDEAATNGQTPMNILNISVIAYSNIKNIARNQCGLSKTVLKGIFDEKTKIE